MKSPALPEVSASLKCVLNPVPPALFTISGTSVPQKAIAEFLKNKK